MKQVVFSSLVTLGLLCLGSAPGKTQDPQALKEECLKRIANPEQHQAQDGTQAPVSFFPQSPTGPYSRQTLRICDQAVTALPQDVELNAQLGAIYLGFGSLQHGPRGTALTRTAAEQGHVPSMTVMGSLNLRTGLVLKNEARAREWFSKAAEAGDPLAQNLLGVIYLAGLGVSADREKAELWFQRAATINDPEAQTRLATHFLSNEFLTQDPQRAAELLTSAAEAGFAAAQRILGQLYNSGAGVELECANSL
ncbi:tetratricopeptide repeat protein [Pelagibius sp. Alg239-R121]|uniref:tetratricopeptide repeat protein n=1 Tax=Pelagibius sp. Alg239-R121 TaxID=2993448 RepID=UPI0024A727B0|nr:tetratricopeptide repeat protein [Pelagibius sp. Alg239-R121]